MAILHEFNGPCVVSYDSVTLGINRESIPITLEPKFLDCEADDYGGPDGQPSDKQVMGVQARIKLQLSKYEQANIPTLLTGVKEATAGAITHGYGTFMRQGGNLSSLVLAGPAYTYTFPEAYPVGMNEFNEGTRYRVYNLEFECWFNLYDSGNATYGASGIATASVLKLFIKAATGA